MTSKQIITYRIEDFLSYLYKEYLISEGEQNLYIRHIETYYKNREMFEYHINEEE